MFNGYVAKHRTPVQYKLINTHTKNYTHFLRRILSNWKLLNIANKLFPKDIFCKKYLLEDKCVYT